MKKNTLLRKAIPSIPRKQQIFRKKVKERIGKEKTLHTNNTAEWHTDFTAKGNVSSMLTRNNCDMDLK